MSKKYMKSFLYKHESLFSRDFLPPKPETCLKYKPIVRHSPQKNMNDLLEVIQHMDMDQFKALRYRLRYAESPEEAAQIIKGSPCNSITKFRGSHSKLNEIQEHLFPYEKLNYSVPPDNFQNTVAISNLLSVSVPTVTRMVKSNRLLGIPFSEERASKLRFPNWQLVQSKCTGCWEIHPNLTEMIINVLGEKPRQVLVELNTHHKEILDKVLWFMSMNFTQRAKNLVNVTVGN